MQVKEDDTVKVGQELADIGAGSGTPTLNLLFGYVRSCMWSVITAYACRDKQVREKAQRQERGSDSVSPY